MKWQRVTVGSIAETVTKGTTPTSIGYKFTDSGIPFLRVNNIQEGMLDTSDILYIDANTDKALSRSRIRPRDVLISIAGTIGRTAVVPPDITSMNCNQAVAIIRLEENVDPFYFSYWLNSRDASEQISGSKVTATISNLSLGCIKNLKAPLPPIEEQKRIAAILDQADAVRRKRKEAIALTEELLRSAFLDMFGDPVTNPKGWEVVQIGAIASRITKGESPKWQGYSYELEGVNFVTSENVLWGQIDISSPKFVSQEFHDKLKRSKLSPDDILINLVGASVGRTCLVPSEVVPANINQAVAVVSLNREVCKPVFLLNQLLNQSIQKSLLGQAVESARANLSLTNIRELSVILPPLNYQNRWKILCENQKQLNNKAILSNIKLQELFNSLLQRAFRGEL
ncbi:restriction modification system DNA specificity domain protein [Thalassoporum mexicanum PCC 7367]|uniref:restriction endonuclease subunit S n=1 Tax=Thalassoporum mexicanum TaxID=3457544 RepID=UPI00029FE2A3|nr:restriction endonuclease subunit S [Pseudanabaena sp. PCC 7367]AFY69171.1 restriction modification system DNA specificity domain protein [Pseudanabaena sp. PCC 7367]